MPIYLFSYNYNIGIKNALQRNLCYEDKSTMSLCAGSVSAVEPSCIHLANRGPFDVAQGSYDAGPVSVYAGPVSAVEPSCIYLANHGPFDVAQGSYGQDR